jgi:hypothetical protein
MHTSSIIDSTAACVRALFLAAVWWFCSASDGAQILRLIIADSPFQMVCDPKTAEERCRVPV